MVEVITVVEDLDIREQDQEMMPAEVVVVQDMSVALLPQLQLAPVRPLQIRQTRIMFLEKATV